MPTDDVRISALEAENAALRGMVAGASALLAGVLAAMPAASCSHVQRAIAAGLQIIPTDGRLARMPVEIEAIASAQGIELADELTGDDPAKAAAWGLVAHVQVVLDAIARKQREEEDGGEHVRFDG